MSTTTLNQIRQLEEQKAELIAAAKEEAMTKVNEGIDTLEALGYQYALVSEKKPKASRPRPGSRKPRADRNCPICEFQTHPPHDGRHHKQQAVKARFTAEELAERGFTMIGQRGGTEAESSEHTMWEFEQPALT